MNARRLNKLKTELKQISERIDKLTTFFLSDTYKNLPLYEKELLNRQAEGMRVYIYYLNKRVKLYADVIRRDIKNAK